MRRLTAATLALALTLVGCGGQNSTEDSSASSVPGQDTSTSSAGSDGISAPVTPGADLSDVDGCGLLTQEEVETLTGGPTGPGGGTVIGLDTGCYRARFAEDGVEILGEASVEAASLGGGLAEQEFQNLKDLVEPSTDLSGVGDEAVLVQYSLEGSQLAIRDGDVILWLTTSLPGQEDFLVDLAEVVLDRLP